MSKIDNFPYPLLFRLKFGGVLFAVDPSCWKNEKRDQEKRDHSTRLISARVHEYVRRTDIMYPVTLYMASDSL